MKSLDEIRGEVSVRVQAVTGQTGPSVLARALQSALYLEVTPDLQEGRSHRGGFPRGPLTWPAFMGAPMLFVLGIRLSELAGLDEDRTLPPTGWLNFFIAPQVTEGAAPLDACAVRYDPDEMAVSLRPPFEGLCSQREGLTFQRGIHSVPQDYEFGGSAGYAAAYGEWEALGFEALPSEVEFLQEADYLLGKQIYATAVGVESSSDVVAFARRQHGQDASCLLALLTLRQDAGGWPFSPGNSLTSLTFFIEAGDLRAHRFEGVMVDMTLD